MGRGLDELRAPERPRRPLPCGFPAAVTGGVARTEPRVPSAQPCSGQSRHPSAQSPLPAPVLSAISSSRGRLAPVAPGSGSLADNREDRATPTTGSPPPDPPQVQPTPLGSPSPPSLHSLPSCSLRPGTSLSGHRRSQLHSPSDSFLFPPSPLQAPPPRPRRLLRVAALRRRQRYSAPSLPTRRAGGAGGGEAETMATRSLTSALQKLGCHGNKAVLEG